MEHTDSMAIVAMENGGSVPCPGGKRTTVKALSWKQVEEISERFTALNPYDRGAVPGSILKIEDDNRAPKTQKQRQLTVWRSPRNDMPCFFGIDQVIRSCSERV
jgi:hypothetical protein